MPRSTVTAENFTEVSVAEVGHEVGGACVCVGLEVGKLTGCLVGRELGRPAQCNRCIAVWCSTNRLRNN